MRRDCFFDELLDQGSVLTLDAPPRGDGVGPADDDEWFAQAATGQRVVAESAATDAQAPLGSAAMPLDGDLVRPPRRRAIRPVPTLAFAGGRHKRTVGAAVLLVLVLAAISALADPPRAAHRASTGVVAVSDRPGRHVPVPVASPSGRRGLGLGHVGATPMRRAHVPHARNSRAANASTPAPPRRPRRATPHATTQAHGPPGAPSPVVAAGPAEPARAPAVTAAPVAATPPASPPPPVQRGSSSAARSPACYPGDLTC